MRVLVFLLILIAVAATGYVAYERLGDRSVAVARRTLPTRLAAKGLRQGQPFFVRIFKQEAVLELWMEGDQGWRLFQSYPICRFAGRLGMAAACPSVAMR